MVDTLADDSILEPKTINLRSNRIQRVLGVSMDEATVEGVLQRLHCTFSKTADGWLVNTPPARFDLTIEEDLIDRIGAYAVATRLWQLRPRAPIITQPSEKAVSAQTLRCWLTGVIKKR